MLEHALTLGRRCGTGGMTFLPVVRLFNKAYCVTFEISHVFSSNNFILATFVSVGLKPDTQVDQPVSLLLANNEVNDLLEEYFNYIVV